MFGLLLGHVVETQAKKGLFATRKSRRKCNAITASLRLAVLTGFQGRVGKKKLFFGHKMRSFARGPPDFPPPPPHGATGAFLAQNLDSARPTT